MKKTLNRRMLKGLALAGTLGLCLALSGCYIPPDEITAGTNNMNVGSNNVPFDPIAPTATMVPTNTPYVPQQSSNPSPQATYDWEKGGDSWNPSSTAGLPEGTIAVTTQRPVPTLTPPTPTPAGSSLKNGAEGTEVRAVQQRLKELGYLKGSVDGDFGAATESAVRAFQQANNLTVDGKVGKNTLTKLNSNNAVPASAAKPTNTPKPKPTNTPKPTATPDLTHDSYLQEGSNGKKVKQLQERLIELGWLSGKADGDFGGATAAAVKAFQKRAGLWDDGIAGPDTQKKLYSSSAPKTSTAAASVGESLKEGMSGDAVRSLQKRLKELDYYSGSTDGKFGEGTKNAVIAFQQANGLKADGIAGTSTLNKLHDNPVKNGSSSSGSNGGQISSTGYVTLREGDKNDSVRKLQEKLKKLGYYSGSVDGSYGSGTVAAVTAFQKANKLRTDGVAGPATQRALYGTNTSISYSTIRPGDEGSSVTNLQYTLYELGYYDDKVDGIYGATTSDAVRAFQIQNDVSPVDGIAGNKTLQKLYSSSAKSATTTNSKYTTLREGDSGNDVVELQDCLKQLGYLADITGVYDSATKAAVKTFQQYNNLSPVDGVAGPDTQTKLYSGSAKPYPGP